MPRKRGKQDEIEAKQEQGKKQENRNVQLVKSGKLQKVYQDNREHQISHGTECLRMLALVRGKADDDEGTERGEQRREQKKCNQPLTV